MVRSDFLATVTMHLTTNGGNSLDFCLLVSFESNGAGGEVAHSWETKIGKRSCLKSNRCMEACATVNSNVSLGFFRREGDEQAGIVKFFI